MATRNTAGAALFAFGLLADSQYADADNGQNHEQTATRYYRMALPRLQQAAGQLSKAEHNVQFLLQLGDLLDGRCKTTPSGSHDALRRALDALNTFRKPIYHVWGNHEFYNFSRSELVRGVLNSSRLPGVESPGSDRANYYHFVPTEGLRIVVLDQFEVSTLGHDPDSRQFQTARFILRSVNKNENGNSPTGLEGFDRRFVEFNGAISRQQLLWLDAVLDLADERHEKVVVAGRLLLLMQWLVKWHLVNQYRHVNSMPD